jgi:endonuclease/exonuclease/phosphatase family metal-dependent hydrolase
VFDGPEDRNGLRNADEVRLVTEYAAGRLGDYFIDDRGVAGAIADPHPFVVLGDLNADPNDGDGVRDAIRDLIVGPRMAPDPKPTSDGAAASAARHADLNQGQTGDAANDTGDFSADGHNNLRIDYALPSKELRVVGSGVYWPKPGEAGAEAAAASDHRLVWVDVEMKKHP